MALYPFIVRDPIVGSVADVLRQIVSGGEDTSKPLDEAGRALMRDSHAMARTAVDVKETPRSYEFVADLPGLSREEVKVQVEDGNTLAISGEREREAKKGRGGEGEKYHRIERSTGKFMRRFTLPQDADLEKIGAQCKDGVLTVTVPKVPPKEPEKPKVVDVKVN